MYEDKILVCKECGKEFTFTAGEQEFYAERGFQNEPQRCKACRDCLLLLLQLLAYPNQHLTEERSAICPWHTWPRHRQ